ncbi:DUF3455 domain-containing protein [Achromobacter sp. JUb104]|uniref:DUF3455 domain-containing protein n=1 Tax=Achromobacter sp. JUb104 TaxID=2940590 RepID=UPI003857C0FC
MRVPAGNYIVWDAPTSGHITYVCQTIHTDGAKQRWKMSSASASLGNQASGGPRGTYASPPETWKSADGSQVTGMEIAHVSSANDQLYDQLVLANPAIGPGILTGVTYIQRLVISGGGLPTRPCTFSNLGSMEQVAFQANYVFWKPE